MQELNDTAHRILDVAERYTQIQGFNAFSYKDIQNEVGVKTSSIHYYFPTKLDLAMSMTERYIERFRIQLEDIAAQESDGIERLNALGQIYVGVVSEGKFCLCGMLASDMLVLPDNVTTRLQAFFSLVESWVEDALVLAKEQKHLPTCLTTAHASAHLVSVLEGAMLIARVRKKPAHLADMIEHTLMCFKKVV